MTKRLLKYRVAYSSQPGAPSSIQALLGGGAFDSKVQDPSDHCDICIVTIFQLRETTC